MLFEPAMIDAFSLALARDVPAIIQPVSGMDEDDTYASERRDALDRFEQETEAWVSRGRALRADIWRMIAEGERGDTNARATLDHMIAQVETRQAEIRAEMQAWRRRWDRILKLSKRVSPALYRDNREIEKRLFATVERRFEERADFVLFLKAVRAEVSPDARGGPSFETADELDTYLRNALGS